MTFMAGRLCPIFMTMSMLISCASIEELPVSMDLSVDGVTPVIKEVEGNVFGDILKVTQAGDRGHALYLKGNNLYCGTGSIVQVYDVSVPTRPILRSQCLIHGSVRQLVADDRAIYVTARGGGVSIIDASDLDNLKYAVRYDAIELATGVDVAGDVLFVTLRGYGVELVDVTDIYNPQHIYCQDTEESQSCWYQDGYLYSGEWGKGIVTTIKASDMSDIRVLSEVELYGHGDGLSTFGNRLYVSTGHHARHTDMSTADAQGQGHGLDVFDISDPAKPVFISRCQFDRLYKRGAGDWWTVRPSADGKTVFVADTFNGLYAVDLSDEANPEIVGRLFLQNDEKPSSAGTYVSSVAVGDGVVYATGQHYGLIVIKCDRARKVERPSGTLPSNPGARHPYTTPEDSHFKAWQPDVRAQVRALAVSDNDLLLAACSDAGLYVLRKDETGGLLQIAKGRMSFAGDVCCRNGRVYVAEGQDGLGVYEISGDGHLTESARLKEIEGYPVFTLTLWVNAVSDRYLIINDRTVGDIVLDMRDFPVMKPVLSHNLGTVWWDKYIACESSPNNYVAAPVVGKGMSWINLNGTPKNTALDTSVEPSAAACPFRNGTVLVNIGAFLTQLKPGVVPAKIISQKQGNFKGSLVWDGDQTLAINFRHGKEFKKAAIPSVEDAVILWREILEGNPDRSIFWDGKILVPAGYQGVLIEK